MFCEESVEKILKCKRCPAFPEQVHLQIIEKSLVMSMQFMFGDD